MLIIQEKLVSDDIIQQQFLCNLEACKGACCWEGEAGAPLEKEELPVLEELYEKVREFISPAGRAVIESEGPWVIDEETDGYATPLIDRGPCAYMTLDGSGTAKCGIEQAWQQGVVEFRKPISCHLYPIRIKRNEKTGFEALNYEKWEICAAACKKGEEAQLPIYRFVKEALIRKYGEEFYMELAAAAENLYSK